MRVMIYKLKIFISNYLFLFYLMIPWSLLVFLMFLIIQPAIFISVNAEELDPENSSSIFNLSKKKIFWIVTGIVVIYLLSTFVVFDVPPPSPSADASVQTVVSAENISSIDSNAVTRQQARSMLDDLKSSIKP